MKTLKHFLPAIGIAGAVAFLYWYIKRNVATGPAQTQGPNPSSSTGLPNYAVPLYNDARTVTNAPSIDDSVHPVIFSGPTSAVGNPYQGGSFGDINGGDINMPMNRLTYNMVPLGITTPAVESKANGSCGCGGGCSSCIDDCSTANSRFPDGRGGCLARSRDQLLDSLVHSPVAIPTDKFQGDYPRDVPQTDVQAECGPGYIFNGTACVPNRSGQTLISSRGDCPVGYVFDGTGCVLATPTDSPQPDAPRAFRNGEDNLSPIGLLNSSPFRSGVDGLSPIGLLESSPLALIAMTLPVQ